MELRYWFKASFIAKKYENFTQCEEKKIILCEVIFIPCEVRLNQTLENSKTQKTRILKFYEFYDFFSEISNLPLQGLNLTSRSHLA